jgi:DNA primase
MNNVTKEKLLELLSGILGNHSNHSGDECSFHCPFCHHHKKKLAVNLDTQKWQCWVCGSKGKSLHRLFKSLNVDESVFVRLKSITGQKIQIDNDDTDTQIYFSLPEYFTPLVDAPNNFETKNVANYLKSRNITREDVIKYNIGYCSDGLYKNYIIIPSYDENGKLNYFVARNYYNSSMKYKNPPISKNEIIFENNISYKLPIVLVEGVFDAITTRRNTIPLLGKKLQSKLYQKILEKNVKDVYIMLDNDARKEALDIAVKLQKQHIKVHVVQMDYKDPNEMGFLEVNKLIKNTEETDFADIVKLQFL